jgi:hypothetical protein
VFSKDQEPSNFQRKLYVRLFKRALRSKDDFDKEVLGKISEEEEEEGKEKAKRNKHKKVKSA